MDGNRIKAYKNVCKLIIIFPAFLNLTRRVYIKSRRGVSLTSQGKYIVMTRGFFNLTRRVYIVMARGFFNLTRSVYSHGEGFL